MVTDWIRVHQHRSPTHPDDTWAGVLTVSLSDWAVQATHQ